MCEIVVLSGTHFLSYCISIHISFQKQPILKQKKASCFNGTVSFDPLKML